MRKFYYLVLMVGLFIFTTGMETAYAVIANPLSIPGNNLRLWLDGADIDGDNNNGNNPGNATSISLWADKSGNSKNAVQANPGRTPTYNTNSLNNLPTINFAGGASLQHLSSGTNTDWNFLHNTSSSTVFVVGKSLINDGSTDFFLSTAGATSSSIGYSFFNQISPARFGVYTSKGNGTFPINTNVTPTDTNYHIHTLLHQNTSPVFEYFKDNLSSATQANNLVAPSTSDASFPLTIGVAPDNMSRALSGNIAEIVVFDRILNPTERLDGECYLSQKWGLNTPLCTSPLVLNNFTSSSANDTYQSGQFITVTANFSNTLSSNSTMTVTLNSGAEINLSTVSGNSLSGIYNPGLSDSANDLTVVEMNTVSVEDIYNNDYTSTLVPASPNNLGDAKNITVQTTYPSVPVIILLGQSNALGRAPLLSIPRTDPTPDFSIYDGGYATATGFETLTQGTNQHWQNPTTQFGPEMGMAYAHKDESGSPDIYLIKYTFGSTYLASVAGTDWNTDSNGEYFDQLTTTVLPNAFNDLRIHGYVPDIKGVVWMQGENDGILNNYANQYQSNLTKFINGLRNEIDRETLPFVIGKVRTMPSAPFASTVRTAQENISSTIPGTCLIKNDDLTLFDTTHFDSNSNITLGKRFWNALKDCDNTVPVLTTSVINKKTITLTYNEPLNTDTVPLVSDFVISVNGSPAIVTNISITGSQLILTLASNVDSNDVVTLSYTVPLLNPIQDWSMNKAITLVNSSLNNTTSHSGGGGGGGGGSSPVIKPPVVVPITPIPTITQPAVCTPLLTTFLRYGMRNNNSVRILQEFLKKHVNPTQLVTGNFFDQTRRNVNTFQTQYYKDILEPVNLKSPTGFVYTYTLNKINKIHCGQ